MIGRTKIPLMALPSFLKTVMLGLGSPLAAQSSSRLDDSFALTTELGCLVQVGGTNNKMISLDLRKKERIVSRAYISSSAELCVSHYLLGSSRCKCNFRCPLESIDERSSWKLLRW